MTPPPPLFAVYISTEHPAPARPKLFLSRAGSNYSVLVLRKRPYSLTERAERNVFHTAPQFLESVPAFNGRDVGNVGSSLHGVIVTPACFFCLFFFFPSSLSRLRSFPSSSPVSTPTARHNLAVLQFRGQPVPVQWPCFIVIAQRATSQHLPASPPTRPVAAPDRPLCQVPCLPFNWRHCALYLSKERGARGGGGGRRRGRASGVCQRGLHTLLLCPGVSFEHDPSCACVLCFSHSALTRKHNS